jgi:hypothetical protein
MNQTTRLHPIRQNLKHPKSLISNNEKPHIRTPLQNQPAHSHHP